MFSPKSNASSGTGPAAGVAPARPAAAIDTSRSNSKAMPSLISAQLTVKGDLSSDGDLQIDGNVEGDVRSKTLTIGESGTVNGSITADTVLIAGTSLGQIRARTVSLVRSARVQGDIWHESLAIEAGAQFEGSCKRLSAAAETDSTATWTSSAKGDGKAKDMSARAVS